MKIFCDFSFLIFLFNVATWANSLFSVVFIYIILGSLFLEKLFTVPIFKNHLTEGLLTGVSSDWIRLYLYIATITELFCHSMWCVESEVNTCWRPNVQRHFCSYSKSKNCSALSTSCCNFYIIVLCSRG